MFSIIKKIYFFLSVFSFLSLFSQDEKSFNLDLLYLKNGDVLRGIVAKLPKLNYAFGDVRLKINDMQKVCCIDENGDEKMQITTVDNALFLAKPNQGLVLFILEDGSTQNIRFKEVDHIDLKRQSIINRVDSVKKLRVDLVSGDVIPVLIEDQKLHVIYEGKESIYSLKDLVNANLKGGISGVIKNNQGAFVKLPKAQLTDVFLEAYPLHQNHAVTIPWLQIAHIESCQEHCFRSNDEPLTYTPDPELEEDVVFLEDLIPSFLSGKEDGPGESMDLSDETLDWDNVEQETKKRKSGNEVEFVMDM